MIAKMKKIYIAPELVVVKINPISVICGSETIPGGDNEVDGVAEAPEFRWRHSWEDEW
jgi:hypothetical protein